MLCERALRTVRISLVSDSNGNEYDSQDSYALMTVSVRWKNRILVMSVHGDIDLVTSEQLADSVIAALSNDPRGLIIDLTDVNFLASAGMKVLMDAAAAAKSSATPFAVVARGAATARPMSLVGVDEVFPVYGDVEEAVVACLRPA
jgi:anti-anti-sigma factor